MNVQKQNDKVDVNKPNETLTGSVAAKLVIRDKTANKELLKTRG